MRQEAHDRSDDRNGTNAKPLETLHQYSRELLTPEQPLYADASRITARGERTPSLECTRLSNAGELHSHDPKSPNLIAELVAQRRIKWLVDRFVTDNESFRR
jgi:hypothetical protein